MLIACSEVKILKKKKECYLYGYGAVFSMENLDNQTFTSTNVKLALTSITLAEKKFEVLSSCCICKVSILVGDRYHQTCIIAISCER